MAKKTLQRITSPRKIKVKATLADRVKQLGRKLIGKRDHKGRFNDRELLSSEDHEISYVKKTAKEILEQTADKKSSDQIPIKASQLRRLCEYILKT